MPPDPVFAPAVIQDRIFTAWGSHNLTRASKRLLAEALKVRWLCLMVLRLACGCMWSQKKLACCLQCNWTSTCITQEPRNRFFVLLSESCMPLYPPQTVYQQLVHAHQSRINACRKDYRDNRDVRRWTHKMTSGTCLCVVLSAAVMSTTDDLPQHPPGFSNEGTGARAGSGLG